MKFFLNLFILLLSVNTFAQSNFDFKLVRDKTVDKYSLSDINTGRKSFLINNKINFSGNEKNTTSCVFVDNNLYLNDFNKNFKYKKKCPGSMMLIFVPLGGIYASYLAYNEFKNGEKQTGRIFIGISTVLIVVPISYMIYCSRH